MKSLIGKLLAALIVTATLPACQATNQESAMQWLQRQPMRTDNP